MQKNSIQMLDRPTAQQGWDIAKKVDLFFFVTDNTHQKLSGIELVNMGLIQYSQS